MNFEKDYIKRLIESMGDFFRKLGDRLDDAEREAGLDRLCRERCGIPLRTAEALTEDSLLSMLGVEGRLALAEILRAKSELVVHTGDERMTLEKRAIGLLLSVGDQPEVVEAVADELNVMLRDAFDLLGDDQVLACASLFAHGGRYDLMDDAVFFLRDALPVGGWNVLCPQVKALYDDALGQRDDLLSAGGLTRAEALDSMTALALDELKTGEER